MLALNFPLAQMAQILFNSVHPCAHPQSDRDGPESVKEIFWSEGPWSGEELEKAWENYYEVQGYSPFATCGNDQCRNKTSVC